MEVLRLVESPGFDNFTLNFGALSFISVVFNRDAKRHATYNNSANKIQSRGERDRSDPVSYHLLQQWLLVSDVRLLCVLAVSPPTLLGWVRLV